MSGSVNKVTLVGNLGRDPEIRTTQDGRRFANLSIATSESWRDKATGEVKEHTDWHRVVIYNERLAEIAEKYLRKGSKVYLEGALKERAFTGNDGVQRTVTEVVLQQYRGELTMLDTRNSNTQQRAPTHGTPPGSGKRSDPANGGRDALHRGSAYEGDFGDDPLPF